MAGELLWNVELCLWKLYGLIFRCCFVSKTKYNVSFPLCPHAETPEVRAVHYICMKTICCE